LTVLSGDIPGQGQGRRLFDVALLTEPYRLARGRVSVAWLGVAPRRAGVPFGSRRAGHRLDSRRNSPRVKHTCFFFFFFRLLAGTEQFSPKLPEFPGVPLQKQRNTSKLVLALLHAKEFGSEVSFR